MKKNKGAMLMTGAAPLVLGLALLSVPAAAQSQNASQPADAAPPTQDIVVTGSRIAQPNLNSIAPVTVVTPQDIKLQGTTRVEDLLNSLPQVFASQASTLANGADGTASVDLRGLGTTRTLTLVNGRRLLPGDPSPSSGSAADINIIPAAMLRRIDVLTGGASSTYGADAVAGVVNFVLDTNFTGLRVDAQYSLYQHNNRDKFLTPLLESRRKAGAPGFDYPTGNTADGGTFDGTIAIGSGFADDRGHAMAYFNYRKAKPILQRDRDYSACVLQNTGSGAPRCGGSATSDNGNAVVWDTAVTTASSTIYTFAPGGGFVNNTSLYNFAPTNHYQRPDERYSAGVFANYEVNASIKPYLEFMFMDDRTVAQIAPSGDFGNTLTINSDNPLISQAQRDVIFGADNLINGYLGTFPLAAGAVYNPNPGAAPLTFIDPTTGRAYNRAFFQLLRRNVEGGPRQSDLEHTNFRTVLGVKGDLGKNWSYDAYYQYGRSNYTQVYLNEFSAARLARALDVVDDPRVAGINPVCRSVLDGSDPACVPYNVFSGAGGASAASVAYLSAAGFQKGHTSEQVADVTLSGKLGDYGIQFPWAKSGVSVAIGAEWRKEALDLQTDTAFQTNDLTGQGGATLPIAGNFRVVEFFGETQIPIVEDSFFHNLAVNAGYRRSDYKTSAGATYGTNTFKVGVEFAPISDIRFRGAFNRAVRAPNIQELFATNTVQLDGSKDPCSGHAITTAEYGCRAQGLAVGAGTPPNPAGQYNGLLGGNGTLTPEIATTKTVGVVLAPSFLRRFTLSADYFDIKVRNAIRNIGADAILADCVGRATASFTPASCGMVHRNAAGSIWLTTDGYVSDTTLNIGSVRTKGIEVSGSYSQPLGSLGSLALSVNGTYLDSYKVDNGLTPYECAGYYGPVCSGGGTTQSGAPLPHWRHKARLTWSGPSGVGVSMQWRYIGAVTAETLSSNPSLHGDFNYDPGLRLKPVSYFDLAGTFAIGKSYAFRIGVNNLFDRQPPFVTSGNAGRDGSNLCPTGPCNGNTYPATYDALGRYLYAGVTLNF